MARFDLDAVLEEGHGAEHDDEKGDDVDRDRSEDHIHPGVLVILRLEPLVDHGGLEIKLHPGGDGGPDHADGHGQEPVSIRKVGVRKEDPMAFQSGFPMKPEMM